MKTVTVLGIGSPFGDDQVGWQVIDNLKHNHALQTLSQAHIKLISCDRPGVTLLDYLRDTTCAILIDALEGVTPGTIQKLSKEELLASFPRHTSAMSSHDIGVVEAVRLGSQLDKLPRQLELFGIGVGDGVSGYRMNSRQIAQINDLVFKQIQHYLQS